MLLRPETHLLHKTLKSIIFLKKTQTFRLLLLLTLFFGRELQAQDTLRLSIEEAEKQFLSKNLLLIAQQCQVQAQDALIIQSRTFANPVITANFNLYDPENRILFHAGPTGNKDFMIEQLIQLGGKRAINIEMAKINKSVAEAEFADLLRTLRFQLHRAFFGIHQSQKNIDKCNRQLLLLDTLINAYKKQADLGNVSMKDLIRLKAGYLKINSEKSESLLQLNDDMSKLNLLLRSKEFIVALVNQDYLDKLIKNNSIAELESMALNHRPDLLAGELDSRYAMMTVKMEKKSRIPDAVFNLATDQRGGAFRNQINIGVAMPLPITNQNRGNILHAKASLQTVNYMLSERRNEIITEVYAAHQNMIRSIEEYQMSAYLYDSNFERILISVNENFKRRNMSILEFLDFLESYNEGLKEIERIKNQIAVNAAQINYVTATKVY